MIVPTPNNSILMYFHNFALHSDYVTDEAIQPNQLTTTP